MLKFYWQKSLIIVMRFSVWKEEDIGPYLAPGAIDFIHQHIYHSYFAPTQSGLFFSKNLHYLGGLAQKGGVCQRKQSLVLFSSSRK